jgi:hypothetical protein
MNLYIVKRQSSNYQRKISYHIDKCEQEIAFGELVLLEQDPVPRSAANDNIFYLTDEETLVNHSQ